MPKPSPELLLTLCDRALSEEIGLLIPVTEPKIFRADLSAAMRSSGDPRYKELITYIPNLPETVFLAKKSTELEA